MYTVGTPNAYFDKNTHEYLIVSKFRNDRVNIVDFLIKAYFSDFGHSSH